MISADMEGATGVTWPADVVEHLVVAAFALSGAAFNSNQNRLPWPGVDSTPTVPPSRMGYQAHTPRGFFTAPKLRPPRAGGPG